MNRNSRNNIQIKMPKGYRKDGTHLGWQKNCIPWNKGLPPWNKGKKLKYVPPGAWKKGHTNWNKGVDNRLIKNCLICGKEFKTKPSENARLCSRECYYQFQVGKLPSKGNSNPYTKIKRGYYSINGKKYFFQSSWEANYALYLDFLLKQNKILKWEYETDVFIFEKIKFGTRSFRPDFKVFENDGGITYHEVKGWMNKQSKTKLNRMRIYYPGIKIRLVDREVYRRLEKQVGRLLCFY